MPLYRGSRYAIMATPSATDVFGEVGFVSLVENRAGIAALTMVQHFKKASFIATPSAQSTKALVSVRGPVQNVYIGHKAPAGNAYNFATTPVAVTFSGSSSVSDGGGNLVDSDPASFSWDGTSDILVAFETVATGPCQAANARVDAYYKSGVTDASTVSKSGYSLIGSTSYGIEALRLSGFAAGVSAPVRGLKVVCDGNSLTAGTGVLLANQYYPSQMASSLRYGSSIVNLGVPSATTSQRMAANGTGPVFSANAIAILWEITNELKDGVSAETAYTNFVSWAQAVRAQGYRVLVGTVIPRSEAGLVGSFETSRQAINTNIRNNWNTFADGICDFGADPSIGAAGASASTTYFNADQVHLNAAGYAVAANIAKTAVLAL